MIIAIDGPAASGKGTLARYLAEQLKLAHLDTGALYRAVGYATLQVGRDPGNPDDVRTIIDDIASHITLDLLKNPALRTDDVGVAASKVSAMDFVRAALLDFQRNFVADPAGFSGLSGIAGAVLDGRDIGTVICPDADVKLYVTAGTEIRAERRYKELQSKGIPATYGAVLEDMKARDARDSDRAIAPLKPAIDAHIIDTSTMDQGQVFEKAMEIVRSHNAEAALSNV